MKSLKSHKIIYKNVFFIFYIFTFQNTLFHIRLLIVQYI